MGIDKGILHAISDHKEKIKGPHFLFSADNPKHLDKRTLNMSYKEVVNHLQKAGYDANVVNDGSPSKVSIVIYGVSKDQAESLHRLVSSLGQESSTYSDGKQSEVRFHHDSQSKQDAGDRGINLAKGEDEEKYKQRAKEGMDLMFPVSVKGKAHRPDIDIAYHSTIKLFDPEKDSPEKVHEIARNLNMVPPDPKNVGIEPSTIRSERNNYTAHIIKLHGPHTDSMKEHNSKFSSHGYKENHEFLPHITVDKETWHNIKNSGAKTAHEAGIEFHPAELRHKDRVVAKYPHKEIKKNEEMEKGIKHVAAALGVAGALASAPSKSSEMPKTPSAIQRPQAQSQSGYSRKKMLNTIMQVESSGGKQTHHKELGGPIHHGESAYGKFALTPDMIRETIHMNRDLRSKYSKAISLRGQDLHNYMKDNPGLEDTIADRHVQRLEHHFGQDPQKIGYAWLEGVSGAHRALKEKKDIGSHWHVKKIKDAWAKVK